MTIFHLIILFLPCIAFGNQTHNRFKRAKHHTYHPKIARVRWVEEVDEDGNSVNMDPFFDRVVMIYSYGRLVTTGVFIDHFRILTSYSPFRDLLSKKRNSEAKLVVAILIERERRENDNSLFIRYAEYLEPRCHKLVVDTELSDLEKGQKYGPFETHTAVHDLYILKLGKRMLFLKETVSFGSVYQKAKTAVGPMRTEVARCNNTLGFTLKLVTLVFSDVQPSRNYDRLSSREYVEEEDVVTDCDQWVPRDWGHFICIKNVDNVEDIITGSLLFHGELLFGVACFTLFKGNLSIIVFTDVRPYRPLMFNTC